MDVSTAFQLQEVDYRDLALRMRMRKPLVSVWIGMRNGKEGPRKDVQCYIHIIQTRDDAFSSLLNTADKCNLILSSYSELLRAIPARRWMVQFIFVSSCTRIQ